jgi:hypothetical protein
MKMAPRNTNAARLLLVFLWSIALRQQHGVAGFVSPVKRGIVTAPPEKSISRQQVPRYLLIDQQHQKHRRPLWR